VSRRPVLLALNFTLGVAALVWLFSRFGAGALSLLARSWSPPLLAAFVATVLAAIVVSAVRWRIVLQGLDLAPSLARLCAFRAASQTVSSVMPGGRLGGEPLRAWYAIRTGVPAWAAITTVAVDRTLEMASSLGFVVGFALILMTRNVPGIERTIAGTLVGAVGLVIAIGLGVRRLRNGGLLVPLVRSLGLTRPSLAEHTAVVEHAEDGARRLLGRPATLAIALGVGIVADLLTLVQYKCLLAAFDLPSTPVAVVAAIFASGAARTLPVPGAVGTVEAAQLWLFGMLGHPPEVGLAVGLATRLRDVAWAAPGIAFMLLQGPVDPKLDP
jgi:uncharacterized protein (TIRG00374 family)